MRDYRDAVIEELAANEHALAHAAAGLRETLHAALERLHDVTCERDQLRKRYSRVLDENRWLHTQRRESLKRAAA